MTEVVLAVVISRASTRLSGQLLWSAEAWDLDSLGARTLLTDDPFFPSSASMATTPAA